MRLNIDLNNINLDNNFDENDPDTLTLMTFLTWNTKFEKLKGLKKQLNEKLMSIVWHPKRLWNLLYVTRLKKIKWNQFLLKFVKVCVGSIQHRGIETFCLLKY